MVQGASQSPECSLKSSSNAVLRIAFTSSPDASTSCPGAGRAAQEGRNLPVSHCIKGSDGWQISPELIGFCKDEPIDKPTFGYLGWAKHIENVPDLSIELVGLCTDICVVSNALILKASFPEATVIVDSSACAGVTPASHEAALATMRMCQIEVI